MAAMVIEGAKRIAQHGRSIVIYMRSHPQINERFPTSEIRIYVTEAED